MAYQVSDSVTNPDAPKTLTFDQICDKIAKLQKEKAVLDKEIKALKVPAKAEVKARAIKTYVTPNGTNVSLYDTNRTNADKAEAARRATDPTCGMTTDDLAAIFKIVPVENFKIK